MKNLLVLLIALIATTYHAFGQAKIKVEYEGVTINNTSQSQADPSAVVDINSVNKGILFPRLTTEQRDQIATPAMGLLIFNVTEKNYEFFDGTTWKGMALIPGGTTSGGTTPPDPSLIVNGYEGTLASGVGIEYVGANSDQTRVNLDVAPSYPFSMRAQIEITAIDLSNRIISLNDGGASTFFCLYVNSSEHFTVQRNDGTGTEAAIVDAPTVATGEKYDVWVVFHSATDFDVIINGVKTPFVGEPSVLIDSDFTIFLANNLRVAAPTYSDSKQFLNQLYDFAITEAQALEVYNNPQQWRPSGAAEPIVDLRYGEAEGKDDQVIFNYGSGNHGEFTTSATSPYNPWVIGDTSSYQTALGQFNRYQEFKSSNDNHILLDSKVNLTGDWTLVYRFIEIGT